MSVTTAERKHSRQPAAPYSPRVIRAGSAFWVRSESKPNRFYAVMFEGELTRPCRCGYSGRGIAIPHCECVDHLGIDEAGVRFRATVKVCKHGRRAMQERAAHPPRTVAEIAPLSDRDLYGDAA